MIGWDDIFGFLFDVILFIPSKKTPWKKIPLAGRIFSIVIVGLLFIALAAVILDAINLV